MSRYEFLPLTWSSTYSLAVGWDEPLRTYFAQVMNYAKVRDDDCVIAWVGGSPPYYAELDDMMRAVNAAITGTLPAITLSKDMQAMLTKDKKRGGRASRRRPRKPLFALELFPDYQPTEE
jgi:hypothetical protein